MKKCSLKLAAFCGIMMMLMASCSTSRATYGNSGSHGWGTESRCGKKKPTKWQRSSYQEDRNGNAHCSSWWDPNPEVSVTPIGEDSLCVTFTWWY